MSDLVRHVRGGHATVYGCREFYLAESRPSFYRLFPSPLVLFSAGLASSSRRY